MFHNSLVQNYEIYAMQFFTLYSFAFCKVLHFAQFRTLHSFQIDLVHLLTDFQHCFKGFNNKEYGEVEDNDEEDDADDLTTSPSTSERGLATLRLGWRRTLLLC